MKHRLAAVAILLCAGLMRAEDPPKPHGDKPLSAPPGADPSKEKEAEKPKWDVANPPYPFDVEVPARRRHRHLDVGRRLARRQGDRLRPAGRHLRDAVCGRTGAGADVRHPLGHAAALLARRQVDRVHVRPLRGRQHLDRRPRRQEPAAGDEGNLPPPQQPGLDARLAVHRGAQALHRHALARRGGDLALAPLRRRGPPDDEEGDRAEGRRRARVLARRPLPLLVRGFDARKDLRVQQGPQRRDLRHQAARPPDRQDRPLRDGSRRLDPPDAVARREVARLHPPRPIQVHALRQGHRVGRRAPDLGRPRARHAGDLGDPGRLSRHGVDAGLEARRFLVRRQDPQRGPRGQAGRRDPVPRPRHPQDGDRSPLRRRRADGTDASLDVATNLFPLSPRWGGEGGGEGGNIPRPHAPLGRHLSGRQARRLPGARLRLRPRPARRHSQTPYDPDRPLRALPVVVARRQVPRLHDLERRHARVDPCGGRPWWRLPRRHRQARPLLRARLLARRLEDRLHEGDRRLPALDGLVRRSGALPGAVGRREVDARRRGRLRAALRQGLRPSLLRQDRRRRRPDRAGEARPRLDQARRLGRPRVLPLRARPGVRGLARREVAGFPRGLQRVRHALRRDRTPRRHRPEEQGRARQEGLEGRRREPPLLGRLRRASTGPSARSSSSGT